MVDRIASLSYRVLCILYSMAPCSLVESYRIPPPIALTTTLGIIPVDPNLTVIFSLIVPYKEAVLIILLINSSNPRSLLRVVAFSA